MNEEFNYIYTNNLFYYLNINILNSLASKAHDMN